MALLIEPAGDACGAAVQGINLSEPQDVDTRHALATALLQHRVLAFPSQPLDDDGLEHASQLFGPFGDDPFIAPIPSRQHIIAVRRDANEQAPIFAESWHTDWSFQRHPPAATCLYGIKIPPAGGDTLYADQVKAAADLPPALRKAIAGRQGIHSAKLPYAPDGVYGEADRASDRSMDIRPDASAQATMLHPLLSPHPDTGEERIFGCVGYVIGIDGVPEDEATDLLFQLHAHQTQDKYIHRQQWTPGLFVIWDNRAVLHRATGGYEGHARLLHRTTVSQLSAL